MLRKEQNDLLTQTGPGHADGRLFRSYWPPVLLAEELPENDCPPVRVKVLSERLVAFRDSEGRYGLIDEFCPHRGASLWFGRNEECGLRCPYHGWKFDVNGQCIEVPSEPEESGFAKKIKLTSYPLVERGGVMWTYMGTPDKQPPLPEYEFATVPGEQRFVSKRLQECNWLQAMEGGINSSHVSFLHRGDIKSRSAVQGRQGQQVQSRTICRPVFEVVESAGGLYIGARRKAEDGKYYWRITQWVMPSLHADRAARRLYRARPFLDADRRRNLLGLELRLPSRPRADRGRAAAMKDGKGVHCKYVPGTYRPLANKDNDYLMDREAQQRGDTYSGVEGIAIQDASLQESMGPIVDRTKENLVGCDNGIIMARHKLMRAAKELVEKGTHRPAWRLRIRQVRSAAVILPPDQPFKDAAKEELKVREGMAHASV